MSKKTHNINESGLLLEGLKQYFVSIIEEKAYQEELMYQWLENLGYD
jgi:hypothetical protein